MATWLLNWPAGSKSFQEPSHTDAPRWNSSLRTRCSIRGLWNSTPDATLIKLPLLSHKSVQIPYKWLFINDSLRSVDWKIVSSLPLVRKTKDSCGHGRRNQNGSQSPTEGGLTMANLNTLLTRPNTGDLWLLLNTVDCYFPKRITFWPQHWYGISCHFLKEEYVVLGWVPPGGRL